VDVGTKIGQLIQVAAGLGTGVAVYVFLSLRMGMEEMDMVINVIGRRFRRKKTNPA